MRCSFDTNVCNAPELRKNTIGAQCSICTVWNNVGTYFSCDPNMPERISFFGCCTSSTAFRIWQHAMPFCSARRCLATDYTSYFGVKVPKATSVLMTPHPEILKGFSYFNEPVCAVDSGHGTT